MKNILFNKLVLVELGSMINSLQEYVKPQFTYYCCLLFVQRVQFGRRMDDNLCQNMWATMAGHQCKTMSEYN